MKKIGAALLLAGMAVTSSGLPGASAEVLITPAEAQLPASVNVPLTTRGLTRGPGIDLESPAPDQGVASPLPLKIKFQARNNIAIDPSSVKVQYLKAVPVDLTERMKKHISADGIAMATAEVPSGVHYLRVDLKDLQGRVATAIVKLTVK